MMKINWDNLLIFFKRMWVRLENFKSSIRSSGLIKKEKYGRDSVLILIHAKLYKNLPSQ